MVYINMKSHITSLVWLYAYNVGPNVPILIYLILRKIHFMPITKQYWRRNQHYHKLSHSICNHLPKTIEFKKIFATFKAPTALETKPVRS